MPLYQVKPIHIPVEKVKTLAAQKGVTSLADTVYTDVCQEVESLCEGKGIFQQGAYDRISRRILCEHPFIINSEEATTHLAYSTSVVLLGATLGTKVVEKVEHFFQTQEFQKGCLYDAAATVALEVLADQMCDYLEELAGNRGYATTWRISPGMGDWPILQQTDLVLGCKGDEIGLGVNDSYMLLPRKSLVALIGLMPEENGPGGGCMSCSKADCHSREE